MIHRLLIVLIGANALCLGGFYYAKIAYNRRFNPQIMHYFSVALVVSFLAYLMLSLFFSVFYVMNGNLLAGAVCCAAFANPFIVGMTGNDYDRAKKYYIVQILFFISSLAFFIFAAMK
jgi:hypothetical protein